MNSFYCSAEYHLARLSGRGSALASLIYSQALHLANKSGVLSASISSIAGYFNSDERTVRSGIKLLVGLGFFEVLRKEKGVAVNYRPIHHRDWLLKRPGLCTEKDAMPWDGEAQDTLGPELHAISGH